MILLPSTSPSHDVYMQCLFLATLLGQGPSAIHRSHASSRGKDLFGGVFDNKMRALLSFLRLAAQTAKRARKGKDSVGAECMWRLLHLANCINRSFTLLPALDSPLPILGPKYEN